MGCREFLHRLTLGSIALGALPASLGATESVPETSIFNEFAALVQQPTVPVFDVTWAQKITGK